MTVLKNRRDATIATYERFKDKPFNWFSASCAHMLRYHGKQMGHKMPTVPSYRSALSAKRSLKKIGFDSLPQLMDSLFPRIAPAQMLVGDMMALPGNEGFEALVIRANVTKFVGWHEDADGLAIIDADLQSAIGAWRL